MKTRKIFAALTLALMGIFSACQSEVIAPDKFSTDKATYDVAQEGGAVTVKLIAPQDWTATVSPATSLDSAEGVTVDPESGCGCPEVKEIKVVLAANEGYNRAVLVAFNGTSLSAAVTINQPGALGERVLSVTCAEFLKKDVDGSIFYQITGTVTKITDEWYNDFYINDGTVEGDGVYVYGLYESKGASRINNYMIEKDIREGDILTMCATRSAYNGSPQAGSAYYISHEKSKTPSIALGSSEVEVTAGSTFDLQVTSNVVTWTLSANVDWITFSQASDNKSATVTVTVADGPSAEGTITLSAEGLESKTCLVKRTKLEGTETIADAIANPGNHIVQGTVMALGARGAALVDETGAVYIYKNDAELWNSWKIGSVYKVTGKTSLYNFGPQISSWDALDLVSEGDGTCTLPEPIVIDAAKAEAYIAAIAGKTGTADLVAKMEYVSLTGTLNVSGSYYNVAIDGTEKAIGSLAYPAASLNAADFNGKSIVVKGFLTSISGNKYLNILVSSIEENPGNDPEPPAGNPGISSLADLTEFAAAVAAGDYSKFVNAAGEVDILADLDFTGVPAAAAHIEKFDGIINGQGHSIKNLKGTLPIFGEVNTVKNLVIDASCSFAPEEYTRFGVVAAKCTGSISDVTNNAAVTMTISSDKKEDNVLILTGIVGHSDGPLTNCVNNGAITLAASGKVIAGAFVAGVAGYIDAPMENCVNNGAISSTVKNVWIGTKEQGYPSFYLKALRVPLHEAGVVAATDLKGTVKNSNNTGAITYILEDVSYLTAEGSGLNSIGTNRPQCAGVVGTRSANVENCKNSGKIVCNIVTPDRSLYTESNYVIVVSGVAGAHQGPTQTYNLIDDASEIISCENTGEIVVEFDDDKSYACVGGISGYPGAEVDDQVCYIRSSVNRGNIVCSGKGKMRIGGIAGGMSPVVDCKNYGNVTSNLTTSLCGVAGISGFISRKVEFKNNENYGDIVSTANVQTYIGALIGYSGNVASTYAQNSINKGNVTCAYAGNEKGALLVGYTGTKKFVLGSAEEPVKVYPCKFTAGGVETIISADNLATFAIGTADASNTTVYATFVAE